jgi:hypothetical protein
MENNLLDDIIGFLAYHGTITYGMLRQNFGERIDERRAARVKEQNGHIAQQPHAVRRRAAHSKATSA